MYQQRISVEPLSNGQSVLVVQSADGEKTTIPLSSIESAQIAERLVEITGADPPYEFWDDKRVSALLELAQKTLANDRVSRRLNIPYYKFGGAVRYRSDEVLAWAAARRRTSTSDQGGAADAS